MAFVKAGGVVISDNDEGNKLHSAQTGEFISAEGGSSDVSEEILDFVKTNFGDEYVGYINNLSEEERKQLIKQIQDILNEEETKENKIPLRPLSEMNEEELTLEARRLLPLAKQYFDINTYRAEEIFGDSMLATANLRSLLELHDKYPLKTKVSIKKNNRYVRKLATASSNCGLNLITKRLVEVTRDDGIAQSGEITLSSQYYTNFEFVKNKILRHADSGYFSQTDGSLENVLKYTVVHEYGHNLAYDIIGDRQKNDIMYIEKNKRLLNGLVGRRILGEDIIKANKVVNNYMQNSDAVLNEIKDEIINIAETKNPYFRSKDNISRYGETDVHEWFAETFASLECGKPNEFALAMKKWLIKNKYMKGGE